MEAYRSARQFGISIVAFTLLFRLFEVGIPQNLPGIRRLASHVHEEQETGQMTVRSSHLIMPFPFPFIAESFPPMEVPPNPTFS